MKLPRKPICETISGSARYGAAPISGLGAPVDGAAVVVVFKEIIRNGKLAWKKIGESRFGLRHGLTGRPYALPSPAADDLADQLKALPNSVWGVAVASLKRARPPGAEALEGRTSSSSTTCTHEAAPALVATTPHDVAAEVSLARCDVP